MKTLAELQEAHQWMSALRIAVVQEERIRDELAAMEKEHEAAAAEVRRLRAALKKAGYDPDTLPPDPRAP